MLAGVKVLAQGRTWSEMEVRWSRVVGCEKEARRHLGMDVIDLGRQSKGYRSLDQVK